MQFIIQTYTNAVENVIIPIFSMQKGKINKEKPKRFLWIFKNVIKFDEFPDSTSAVSGS
jgi:hypothetical protein